MFDAIKNFFIQCGDWLLKYVDLISRLPALWRSERMTFFIISGSLLFIVLIVVLIVVLIIRRKRGKYPVNYCSRQENKKARKFIPVESSGTDLDTVFLSLADLIANEPGPLSDNVRARIQRRGTQALEDIVAAYNRANPEVKKELACMVRETKMMETYSRHLEDKGYSQGVILDAWRCFPDETVLRSFVELLASRDEKIQRGAVKLLCSLHEPKCLPMLMMTLVQPDRYLPSRVAEVFCSMPQQSAALLAYMLPEIDDKHKEAVLEIIAQTEAKFEPDNVAACLRHKNYHIRSAAALALGSGRITEAIPNLMLAAADKRWQVRAATAKALGLMGDVRAMSVLEALSHDTEGWVAGSAKEALAMFQQK